MGIFRSFKARAGTTEQAFEMLETRLALYQNPMIQRAPIASLENANDSVVRIDTNMGRFDIELFDSLAPVTVMNFKRYIAEGKFDESFFHQLTAAILGGGRYKFRDGVGLSTVTPDAAIPNGFTRSNLAQTLAMVPDTNTTTTDRFIINLVDNTAFNSSMGGYPVFGKVVQGWSVVQAIAARSALDLDQQLTGSNPNPGTFDVVPVTSSYNSGVGPTEATLIKILDIEITKANGQNRYYEQSYVMSEGMRTATSIERIDLVNQDALPSAPEFPNYYQVILRYESGDRDQVIYTGVLQPHARTYVKINDLGSLVRTGVAYSYEVRSTRAMGVSLDHRDTSPTTSYTTGEQFLIEARLYESQLRAWNIGDGAKGANDTSIISFESLSDQDINVYMLIFPEGGGAATFYGTPLKALRRGTLNINSLGGVANGHFAVQISATGPIAAALSHYKSSGGSVSDGDLSLGVTSGGRIEGFLGGALVPTGGKAHLDFFYSAGAALTIVDIQILLTDGTVLTPSPVTLTNANRKQRVDLAGIAGIPVDQYFSVHYTSRTGTIPVTASYEAERNGDSMSAAFQTMTTQNVTFADGYTDPTLTASQMSETISILNPYASNVNFLYDLFFHFSDGTTVLASGGSPFTLDSRHRADHQARDFPAVMTKINANPAFRFYSVEIRTVQFVFPTAPPGAVVASLTRIHNTWGQNFTTTPGLDPRVPLVFMEDPALH